MKVVVIGAGPAGLSCAYELAKKGIEVEVFEASGHVGGMARSFDLWGQRVDLGPHRFFSNEKMVNQFFIEIMQDDFTMVNRLTRIHYRKRFFNYPLKLTNVLRNLPLSTIARILWDYFVQKIFPIKNPLTFEQWVTNRFGKKLYTIFFKNYSEKLWGIPCSQIDADWASQRIKGLSLWGAVVNALIGNRNNKHKTLIDQFAYPENGTGTLYERCVDYITEHGGKIYLNKPVKKLCIVNKKATGITLTDGTIIPADVVISTMPLTHLVKGLEGAPQHVVNACNQLYFRNTILVYLEVHDENLFNDNWIYVHSPDVKHGRITNFRNWSPSLNRNKNTTILCMEFWAFTKDEIWEAKDDVLAELAKKEIRQMELVKKEIIIGQSFVLRVPKCYPVYETGYQKHLKIIENYLDEFTNLLPIGRYGAFKYNNQDHSILMGILAAKNILLKKQMNLWNINTDREYQEDGKIEELFSKEYQRKIA